MEINPSIFKAYDIRGIYPSEINTKIANFIGRAFVKFLKNLRKLRTKQKLNIVVGRDNRISSPALFESLVLGIIDSGVNVIDIGLSASPMLYWACAHYKFDGGIEVTASHNPPEFNGFKLVRNMAIPVGEKTGLKEIKKLVFKRKFKKEKKGRRIKKRVLKEYLAFILKDFELKKLKRFKIVVDTGNTVTGKIVKDFFKRLPIKTNFLFLKLDGRFPNHLPDPSKKENLKFLRCEIKNKKADFGIAFDGDGDRIVFVDEKARIISGDLITATLSEIILSKKPGEKILYDIKSSNIVKETILKNKGIPIISRVGHSFIKERMRKENILFAGETSGHYYLKNHYFSETPFFVLLKVLEKLSESKKSLSRLIRPFSKYFSSGEINFPIKEKKKALESLEKKYKKGKISHLDGVKINFKNWWFLVRPSQTEDVLRLLIEAKTKTLMEKKKQELIKLIKLGPFFF